MFHEGLVQGVPSRACNGFAVIPTFAEHLVRASRWSYGPTVATILGIRCTAARVSRCDGYDDPCAVLRSVYLDS